MFCWILCDVASKSLVAAVGVPSESFRQAMDGEFCLGGLGICTENALACFV